MPKCLPMRIPRLRRAPRIRLDSAKETYAVFYSAVHASVALAAFILYAVTVCVSTNIDENPMVEGNRLGQYLKVSNLFCVHCYIFFSMSFL